MYKCDCCGKEMEKQGLCPKCDKKLEELVRQSITIQALDDPIIEIAKCLKSIDRTLKHIEENMRKRKV